MRNKRLISLILSLSLLLGLMTWAGAAEPMEQEGEFDGYLIKITEDAPASAYADWKPVIPNVYKTYDYTAAMELLAKGYAEYVEPNYLISLPEPDPDMPSLAAEAVDLAKDWYLKAMNVSYASDLGLDGEGVRIAIIDTGIDLSTGEFDDANIFATKNYLVAEGEDNTAVPDDSGNSHGTQVATLIAGGSRGAGIAPKAELVILKTFGPGYSSFEDIATAVFEAATVYECDIINMSFAGGDSETWRDSFKLAYDAGAVLVAASGNVSSDYPQGMVFYPANYEHVIGVGNVDHNLIISSGSQQTSAVMVSAPGTRIFGPGSSSGTSFACPCVAAAVALLLQLDPSLTNYEVMELLCQRAQDLGDPGYDVQYGYGFVDVQLLLSNAHHTVEVTDEGVVTIQGWETGADENDTVFAILYSEAGKMISAQLMGTGSGSYGYSFRTTGNPSLGIFHIDNTYGPNAESKVYSGLAGG